jgi:hypothetical protein
MSLGAVADLTDSGKAKNKSDDSFYSRELGIDAKNIFCITKY